MADILADNHTKLTDKLLLSYLELLSLLHCNYNKTLDGNFVDGKLSKTTNTTKHSAANCTVHMNNFSVCRSLRRCHQHDITPSNFEHSLPVLFSSASHCHKYFQLQVFSRVCSTIGPSRSLLRDADALLVFLRVHPI